MESIRVQTDLVRSFRANEKILEAIQMAWLDERE
jgi:FeS assembly protein IscX